MSIVVEDDIDPSDDEQVEWAIAHRVNAGEGGVVIFPGIFGSPIDPSTPMEDRDVAQLGTGLWNRMLDRRHALLEESRGARSGAASASRPPCARRPDDERRTMGRVRSGRVLRHTGLGDLA